MKIVQEICALKMASQSFQSAAFGCLGSKDGPPKNSDNSKTDIVWQILQMHNVAYIFEVLHLEPNPPLYPASKQSTSHPTPRTCMGNEQAEVGRK